ncbi:MAG: ABC transporter ATP-binding protein [Gemmatimonadetes bacterium]|nr:ABC transporter ATP-binding protein [Gemmatimonadota bacterium]
MTERRRTPLARMIGLLAPTEQRALVLVVVSSFVTAVFETLGVVSILPFMAVVMDPTAIQRYGPVADLLVWIGADSPARATMLIGVATIVVLALGNAATAANVWVQQRFLMNARTALSTELFGVYMRMPYAFHVERDSASLVKVMFEDIEVALGGFLAPLLQAISKGLVAVLLLGLVVTRDPVVALATCVLLGGSYFIVYRYVRVRQSRHGQIVNAASLERQRIGLEGLAGVKELHVLGREDEPVRLFHLAFDRFGKAHAASTFMTQLPKSLIEVVAFGGVVAITLVLLAVGDVRTAIPTLALYSLAGYRLMPALQQLYSTAISLRFNEASVTSLERDLARVRSRDHGEERDGEAASALPFERELSVSGVTFTYANAPRPALRDIELKICRKESIGLVGRTGAGKSTLADLLLGLYVPEIGSICVDGVALNAENVRSWRRFVGYVPQSIFLANASVRDNIALGIRADLIDSEAVVRAAQMAQADEFIVQLANGYDTIVGERGVRLSGGQRQRLGIARALYRDPAVLVFDEATSALDGMTEEAVMDAVRGLSQERTVVLVAHRLRTVEACDRIVVLDAGRIVADGPYADLVHSSAEFQSLLRRPVSVDAHPLQAVSPEAMS